MEEKKMQAAERLYEALGGVDPELLARSEAENKKKVIPFGRWAKAMAACLALVVVGGACWATMHNGLGKEANDMASSITQDAREAIGMNDESKADLAADNADSLIQYEGNSASEASEEAEFADNEPWAESENKASEGMPQENAAQTMNPSTDSAAGGNKYEAQPKKYLSLWKDEVNLDIRSGMTSGSLEIAFGEETPVRIKSSRLAKVLYDYFCNLQTVPARDADFGDCVTVNLYDGDGNVADEFRISGPYVQRMGMEGTYEIVEEGYSYENLREALRQISEEGQE